MILMTNNEEKMMKAIQYMVFHANACLEMNEQGKQAGLENIMACGLPLIEEFTPIKKPTL